MKRMFPFFIIFLLLVPTIGITSEISPICGTSWEGHYFYPVRPGNELERSPVKFDFVFACSGDTIKGRITEPNTFGDKTSANLYANVSVINIDPNNFEFMKVYDGTGGVSHSVNYSGIFKTNRFIVGIWKIIDKNGSTYSGFFEMHR